MYVVTEGQDFAGLSRTVTLTPTNAQQCVTVMIEDDSVSEETESLTVSLSLTGVVDSVLLSQHTATIMIVDNDSKQPIICVDKHTFEVDLFLEIWYSNVRNFGPSGQLYAP